MRAIFWALALAASACHRAAPSPPEPSRAANPQPEAASFTILAGSELRDLEPALVAAGVRAGLRIQLSYAGTLDAVDRLNAGERFDALLPPNGAYPMLALTHKPLAREKLFYSRVALGVKLPKAASLGWDASAPTWSDIAHAAKAGSFRYAMTNPTSSNTGMSALFAVAAAAAKKTEDLTVQEIDSAILRDFLSGQKITAGSSGWLADAFLKQPGAVDGLVNYEAVLLRLNEQLSPNDRLRLIYPKDGVISADYPLLLLQPEATAQYQKLVALLKAPEFQRDALQPAYLRPSNPDAPVAPALPGGAVAELTFPGRLDVIDQVLMAYLSEWRRPSTSIFVLDVSDSMRGQRLSSMRDSLKVLTGVSAVGDNASSTRYAGFQSRERVVLITFASDVAEPQFFDFEPNALEQSRSQVRGYADALATRGLTAIFSALERAAQVAHSEAERDPNRFISIVLLSDGESNSGLGYQEFREQFKQQLGAAARVRVFPILFGEANVQQMQELAEWTGGRAFDARKTGLASVFKEIRGYQ